LLVARAPLLLRNRRQMTNVDGGCPLAPPRRRQKGVRRMSEATSLRRHLIDELRDLLDAEQQLTRALPRFAEAAATPPLKQAFQKHLKETERHLDRLNQ